MKFSTKAVHIGEKPDFSDGASGDVVVPLHLSATFARREIGKPTGGYEYSRSGNPTRNALEKKLAALEGAEYGLAFASGLAAETTLLLSLLKSGDHVVASDDIYGGTRRLFASIFEKFGIGFTYADTTGAAAVVRAFRKNTRLLFLETPTNPLLKLSDIQTLSQLAHERSITVAVDNTFASPYLQQPILLGADIALHSTTKYINGHSDSVGGAIMLSDSQLHKQLRFFQNAAGAILSPFDSFLTLRGIKTLAVRMEKHSSNAMEIAEFLSSHQKVKSTIYPGLPSHPQHELAKRQMMGFGGIISFEIQGGLPSARKFLSSLELFHLAESLGGVESLAEHPASMTHASVPASARKKLGITDSLIRLSVGIEDVPDLIDDLNSALSITYPK